MVFIGTSRDFENRKDPGLRRPGQIFYVKSISLRVLSASSFIRAEILLEEE